MTITVRSESFTVTDTATQDLTIPGLGAAGDMVAAVVYAGSYSGSSDYASETRVSLGFVDTVGRQQVSSFSLGDNLSTQDGHRAHFTGQLVNTIDAVGASTNLQGAFNQWITDGIRVNWDVQTASPTKVTVKYFCDDAETKVLKARVGKELFGETIGVTRSVSIPGVNPTLVYTLSSCQSTIEQIDTFVSFTMGYAIKTLPSEVGNHTINDCYTFADDHGNAAASLASRLSVADIGQDWCINNIYKASSFGTQRISRMGTGEMWMEQIFSAGDNHIGYLALEGLNANIIKINSPAAAGTWNVSGAGFIPQHAMGICSTMSQRTANSETDEAAAIGFYFCDADSQYTHGYTANDGSATTDTSSTWTDGNLFLGEVDQLSTLFSGSFDNFDSDGLNLTFAETSTQRKWSFLVIEEDAATPPAASTVSLRRRIVVT